MNADVIIIGGSLAGSACALELRRRGIDAVVFDRDRFPRRKVCGGFLSPGAVESLRKLDLLADVLAAGAVEVRSARVRAGAVEKRVPFERPGLGISRMALDTIFARRAGVHEAQAVDKVERSGGKFVVNGAFCKVVIDACGKLSRFTHRQRVEEFGIQYSDPAPRGSTLDFWFQPDAYGGAVSVEDGGANFCFLVAKGALRQYLRPDCVVTGPLAYDKLPGDFIAIGDAAGMVDPFCGEGMRHAMETGMLAARVVADALRRRAGYEEMKWQYEAERTRQWGIKRAIGGGMRQLRPHFAAGLRLTPPWLLNRLLFL